MPDEALWLFWQRDECQSPVAEAAVDLAGRGDLDRSQRMERVAHEVPDSDHAPVGSHEQVRVVSGCPMTGNGADHERSSGAERGIEHAVGRHPHHGPVLHASPGAGDDQPIARWLQHGVQVSDRHVLVGGVGWRQTNRTTRSEAAVHDSVCTDSGDDWPGEVVVDGVTHHEHRSIWSDHLFTGHDAHAVCQHDRSPGVPIGNIVGSGCTGGTGPGDDCHRRAGECEQRSGRRDMAPDDTGRGAPSIVDRSCRRTRPSKTRGEGMRSG